MAEETIAAGFIVETAVNSLGVAVQALALDATITPQTLAALAAVEAENAPRRVGPHGLTLATLPRISLAGRANTKRTAGAGEASTEHQPDLEIVGLLGEGGMGRVHLARQRSLHRDVAIKTLKPEVDHAGAAESLLGEAVINGLLEHPNIIPVHALGCDDAGRPVLVMKRVEGVAWRELLLDARHPKWERVVGSSSGTPAGSEHEGDGRTDRLVAHLEVLMQVCNALHFAHSRGVVHRDVKPENVMIGDFGEVHLLDWGIAMRVPADEDERVSLVGTPGYMAPEMVALDRRRLGPRTDVYLLGATLHEILTRKCRHDGSTLQAVLLSAYASEPFQYDPAVPSELAALANAATSADPDARPASALAFRQAIADYLRHRASLALGRSAATRLAEFQSLARNAADSDDVRVRQLMTECRFGFAQALREWDGNAAARSGLREALLAMAGYEIARGNADAARALLAEVSDAPGRILALLAALDQERSSRAHEQREFQRMRQEMDHSVGARQRMIFMGGLLVLALAISVTLYLIAGKRYLAPPPKAIFRVGLTVLTFVGIGGFVGRRFLLRNTAGRNTFGIVALCALAMVVHRGLALLQGTDTPTILADDLVIVTFICAAGVLAVARQMVSTMLCFFAGAVGVVLFPQAAIVVFTLSMLGAILTAGLTMRALGRSSASSGPGGSPPSG